MGGYFAHMNKCPQKEDPSKICECERLMVEHIKILMEIDRETYQHIKENKR